MARKAFTLFYILIAILASGCSKEQKTVAPSNGTINGRVTVDGVGMAGVTVTISLYTHSMGGAGKIEESAGIAESSGDGDYSFDVLPGQYRIEYDIVLNSEELHTARYPIIVTSGNGVTVNVELKDPVPANLIAVNGDACVILSWEHAYHADSYNIYRALHSTGIFQMIATADTGFGTITKINIPPTIDGYEYKVSSVSEGIESAQSNMAAVDFTASITPPTNFTASDQITHVYLQWSANQNAVKYKIFRAINTPTTWELIDSTSQNNYTNVPSSYGNYYYRATAVSSFNTESQPSTNALVNYDGRYDPPTGLVLIDRGSNIYLTWQSNGNSGYYNIYRSTPNDTEYVKIDTTYLTYFENTPATHDNYRYKVSIVGPNGLESELSQAVSVFFDGVLDPPDRVTARDQGLSVLVSWDVVLWAGAYLIYRSDDNLTYHQIGRVTSVSHDMTDIPPQPGDYRYKVATETVDGVPGQLSNFTQVYFSNNLPFPLNVSAENFGLFVTIQWDQVAEANSYVIYRAPLPGGAYMEIDTTDQTSFTDVPVSAGPYYYRVRAKDNAGHISDYSFYAYTYFTARPLPPTDVTATDELFKVVLRWASLDTVCEFKIYRSFTQNGDYLPIDSAYTTTYYEDWPDETGHYYYKIQAITGTYAISDLSESAHVYFSGILQVPTNLSGYDAGTNVRLLWNDVTGASEYNIYRSLSISDPAPLLTQTVYAAEASDIPDSAGTYYYSVSAKTRGGLESAKSAPIVVIFDPNP